MSADENNLRVIADVIRVNLDLPEGPIIDIVDSACIQLGIKKDGTTMQLAQRCHEQLMGDVHKINQSITDVEISIINVECQIGTGEDNNSAYSRNPIYFGSNHTCITLRDRQPGTWLLDKDSSAPGGLVLKLSFQNKMRWIELALQSTGSDPLFLYKNSWRAQRGRECFMRNTNLRIHSPSQRLRWSSCTELENELCEHKWQGGFDGWHDLSYMCNPWRFYSDKSFIEERSGARGSWSVREVLASQEQEVIPLALQAEKETEGVVFSHAVGGFILRMEWNNGKAVRGAGTGEGTPIAWMEFHSRFPDSGEIQFLPYNTSDPAYRTAGWSIRKQNRARPGDEITTQQLAGWWWECCLPCGGGCIRRTAISDDVLYSCGICCCIGLPIPICERKIRHVGGNAFFAPPAVKSNDRYRSATYKANGGGLFYGCKLC